MVTFLQNKTAPCPRVLGGCPGRSRESGLVWSPESGRWTGSRRGGPAAAVRPPGGAIPGGQGTRLSFTPHLFPGGGVGGAVLALPAGQLGGPGQIT